jgi:hypothetical protein
MARVLAVEDLTPDCCKWVQLKKAEVGPVLNPATDLTSHN